VALNGALQHTIIIGIPAGLNDSLRGDRHASVPVNVTREAYFVLRPMKLVGENSASLAAQITRMDQDHCPIFDKVEDQPRLSPKEKCRDENVGVDDHPRTFRHGDRSADQLRRRP
jgi:hypothetical protein